MLEPAFYAYAVPEPGGFKTARVEPDGAFYHPELKEFVLPYNGYAGAPRLQFLSTALTRLPRHAAA